MAEFNESCVTNAGLAAMQEALDNGYTMTFTALVTGDGTYTAGESLAERTALKSQQNSYVFSNISEDASGATLSAAIVNHQNGTALVNTTYNVNEIGIICTVNSVEYLYAISVVADGTGTELPAYTGTNPVEIVQDWFVANSNNANITIDSTGAYALVTKTDQIDANIGAVENLLTATSAHSIGETFVFMGQFVKATASIAIGDTIEIGTTVEETTVSNEVFNKYLYDETDGTQFVLGVKDGLLFIEEVE